MVSQPLALNGAHAINVIAHADQGLIGGVDVGTTPTDLHDAEWIDGAGHRSEIAHPKEFFGQGSFCACWGFWITFEDLLGHPARYFLPASRTSGSMLATAVVLPRKINEP